MYCSRIDTNRFYLRSLRPEDASEGYLSWFKQGFVSKYIETAGTIRTISDLRLYIFEKTCLSDVLFLGIFTKENGLHIGNIKYEPVNLLDGHAVLGVLIGESGWRGLGAAEEAIRASSGWLFRNFGIDKFALGVDLHNIRAISLYKRLGFHEENTNLVNVDNSTGISMVLNLSDFDLDID